MTVFYYSCLANSQLTPPGSSLQCNHSVHEGTGCSGRQCCNHTDHCNAHLKPSCKTDPKLSLGQGEMMKEAQRPTVDKKDANLKHIKQIPKKKIRNSEKTKESNNFLPHFSFFPLNWRTIYFRIKFIEKKEFEGNIKYFKE